MRTRFVMAVAIALAASGVLISPAQAADHEISGTVTGPGATPLVGVPVTAYSADTPDPDDQTVLATTTTIAGGHYTLTSVEDPAYVCFESPDYVRECWNDVPQGEGSPSSGTVVAPAPSGVTGVDAALITGGSLTGTLTSESGPVTHGAVTAELGTRHFLQVTDLVDGSYAFHHLPPGTYHVCAGNVHLIEQCSDHQIADGAATSGVDFAFVERPENVRVAQNGTTRIRWIWDEVPGAIDYRIAVSTSPKMTNPKIRYVGGRFATYTGLVKGRTYYVAVRAQNNVGGLTISSPVLASRTGVVNGIVLGEPTSTTLFATWAPYIGAEVYQYRLSSLPSFAGFRSLNSPDTNEDLTGLKAGTTYYLQIRVIDGNQKPLTPWSSTASAATLP